MQPYLRSPYSLLAVAKATARLLNFNRFLRASGLGRVSLASQRQTVDADTPSLCANSAWDASPRSSLISSPVITMITQSFGNNRCAACRKGPGGSEVTVELGQLGKDACCNRIARAMNVVQFATVKKQQVEAKRGRTRVGGEEVWECGSMGVWEYGTMGVWECESEGVWECGSVGVWGYGSVEVWQGGVWENPRAP